MGHESHSPDGETTKTQTPQQAESMSTDQKKKLGVPHNHADPKD